jgi:NAD(P)H-dependent flavin oxidoreductase YrpB (nitropropane dioxygenase family)
VGRDPRLLHAQVLGTKLSIIQAPMAGGQDSTLAIETPRAGEITTEALALLSLE